MHRKLCPCGNADRFEVGGFGLDTCCVCGICIPGVISDMNQYVPADRIMHPCTYTRRKRFRRYLLRANRNQSCNTVPAETWAYLLSPPLTRPRARSTGDSNWQNISSVSATTRCR